MPSGYAGIVSDTSDAEGFQSIHHDAGDTEDAPGESLVSGHGAVESRENLLFPDDQSLGPREEVHFNP